MFSQCKGIIVCLNFVLYVNLGLYVTHLVHQYKKARVLTFFHFVFISLKV